VRRTLFLYWQKCLKTQKADPLVDQLEFLHPRSESKKGKERRKGKDFALIRRPTFTSTKLPPLPLSLKEQRAMDDFVLNIAPPSAGKKPSALAGKQKGGRWTDR
jgi:hypothetical protein